MSENKRLQEVFGESFGEFRCQRARKTQRERSGRRQRA